MKNFKLTMTALLLMLSASLFAQNIQIKGTVTDAATGDPIPYASVVVKGSMTGTSTNLDGDYSLSAPSNATLTFTFVGYDTVEEAVNGRQVVNIELTPSAEALSDVLVVAYGTAKKESFTGSASAVSGEKIAKRTVANVTKALDGMAAGITSLSGSGQPGASATVVIRGYGSINASRNPLYVVDGVPYDGNMNAINPSDIESMTVIKDASAGALYGSRGANGVIIITTKKGSEGKIKVNLKANVGVSSRAIPRYETLDSKSWLEDTFAMYKRRQVTLGDDETTAGLNAINAMVSGSNKIFGINEQYNPLSKPFAEAIDPSTGKIKDGITLKWNDDWLDLSTNPSPIRQEYQLSVNGGSQKVKYMFSLGYLNEKGLVRSTGFERFSGRANVDAQIKDWFKAGLNANLALTKSNSTSLGSGQSSSSSYSNVFYTCQLMSPIYPFYQRDANGNLILDANGNKQYDWGADRPSGASAGWNPVANLEEDKIISNNDNVSARTYVTLGGMKEGALQGLALTANFGVDYVNAFSKTYYNPNFGNAASSSGAVYDSFGRTLSYTFNQLLTYNRSFGKHTIDFLAGHENYDKTYRSLSADKEGFPVTGVYELDAATNNTGIGGYVDTYRIESFLTRLNYDFDDKYYVSASYRRDGSSRFNQEYRWGNFWSVGASWRISQEKFMQDAHWLNNLTLKASYGVQGNDNIGDYYAWQSLYNPNNANGSRPGVVISSLETKNVKWEKNDNFNVGIETRMADRVSLSAEYYIRYTKDMLMSYPLAISLGFSGYNKNVGNMKNSGFEFTIAWDVFKRQNFYWTTTLIGSTNKNIVTYIDGQEIISGNQIIREGYPLYSYYLAESAGVDPETGNKLYWITEKDASGNETKVKTTSYTKAQNFRSIVGKRSPDLYGSWNNDFRFYNFDLSIMTTYSIGGVIYDNTYYGLLYHSYIGQTGHVDRLKAWQKPGDVTNIPRIDFQGASKITTTSDQLVSASYFSLKNITFGYTLPAKIMGKINMDSLRIFLTADNIWLKSAIKGMDPQYSVFGGTGYTYTPTRTVSLGLDINF
ncbi:MAG: TonB-dependent receptor [Bacteroidales bacterium]|nr:TonB-dependent receptor [Bacteroidales bacterium]